MSVQRRTRPSPVFYIAVSLCILLPVVVLFGWQFGVEILTSGMQDGSTMNPLTALSCLLQGTSLYVFASSIDQGTARRILLVVSSMVGVIVSLRLASIAFAWSWSPDRVMFVDRLRGSEMSLNTAIGILASNVCGVLYGTGGKRAHSFAQLLAIGVAIVGCVTVLSYSIGFLQGATIEGFKPMSLPSGLVIALLGLSMAVVRPSQGVLSVFSGTNPSAKLARRLLVTSATVVIAINLLRLGGEFYGLYDRPVSIVLFSTVAIAGLATVIAFATRAYAKEEAARLEAEAFAKKQSEFVRAVVDAIPGFVFAKDSEGRFVFANQGTADSFGKSVDEVIGKRTLDFMPETEELRQFLDSDARVLETGQPENFEAKSTLPDGSVRWLYNNKRRLESPYTGEPVVFGIVTDITELTQAREEAKRANQAKSEFISRMSHELRTPLNAVMGFAQLIQLHGGDERAMESAEQINKAGKHLLDLINEVLDLSRIEAGRLTVSIEPVIVEEAVHMALGIVRPIADGRGVAIDVDGSLCDTVAMQADRQRLSQIIINLLSNAVKYNRRNGSVAVKCGEEGDCVYIEFSDTGTGISAEDRHRLFEPFERLSNGEVEGTGLGLALSRHLAQAMKGSLVLVKSSAEGSTFRLELPRAELVKAQKVAKSFDGSGIEAGQQGVTVLYIEDNLANLRLVERVLEEWGPVKVLSAMQGSIGLEVVRSQRPNLVLLDLHLPDMSGLDVLREIRLDDRTAHIPVIVLSADATSGQIKKSLSSGADDYLTKPIDIVKMLRLLTALQSAGWKRTTSGE